MHTSRSQTLNPALNFNLTHMTLKENIEKYNKLINIVATETDVSTSLTGYESEPVSSIFHPYHVYP
jgi:hypothetical protein